MEGNGHGKEQRQREDFPREEVSEIYFLLFSYHKHSLFRYSEDLELEDAVHTAILTLKEGFEGQMTEDNIEIGICNDAGFRRLTPQEVKDYLANIQ